MSNEYGLDLIQYACPLPLLMTKRAMASLLPKESLVIMLDPKTLLADFLLLCQTMGYHGEVIEQTATQLRFRLTRQA